MFEFGRDLRRLFEKARDSDDLGWLELIGAGLVEVEARQQAVDAGRVSCTRPFDAALRCYVQRSAWTIATPDDVAEALAFNPDEWREEIPSIEELFDFVGEKLPSSLRDELDGLKQRLA